MHSSNEIGSYSHQRDSFFDCGRIFSLKQEIFDLPFLTSAKTQKWILLISEVDADEAELIVLGSEINIVL